MCSREHFGGELDSILYCIHLCFAGAESLAILESASIAVMLCRG